MSEDWIPVPEIENVLIVVAKLAEDPVDIQQAPVMPFLERLKGWTGGSVYLFHDPPEAGEVLEDVDPDMASRFALAAQMSDIRAEVCRDALRRVFSRATVQRVVLISDRGGDTRRDSIERLFRALEQADIVWAGEWPWHFAVAMCEFQGEIFSDLDTAETDLGKAVQDVASKNGLTLVILDAL